MSYDKTVTVVTPHGFCAGVVRAIDTAEAALHRFGAPLYCLNEVVHNQQVVDKLTAQGVIFVHELEAIPPHSVVLFSAHGVSPETFNNARIRKLKIIDATCPFVAKVHAEVRRYASRDYAILLIGHRTHEEIIGVRGEAPEAVTVIQTQNDARIVSLPQTDRVAVLTQTTLSVDEADRILKVLKKRFPRLERPAKTDICYATEHRQEAVKRLATDSDLILVLGSSNSSNSRRLVEVATQTGCPATLISKLSELNAIDFTDKNRVGITSGASTPESFLEACVQQLSTKGFHRGTTLTAVHEEQVRFPLPRDLRM
ncbi:MAG: 4-hydroxy-3-methylbut-2-enyl diphosphate reductase [Kiritimatiellae bacterium]|nr:4-hydroxy-3-methylbut-2-enyl diphosphate reductase [Kiritimatiellia bacterium]